MKKEEKTKNLNQEPFEEYFNWYKSQLSNEFPELGPPVKPRKKRLENFLESLIFLNHHDEYYLIRDLRTFGIDWAYGIKRALGYEDDVWMKNPNFSFDVIHKDYKAFFTRLGALTYKVVNHPEYSLRALQHRYIINIPVKKENGTYVWVKQMSMPIQLDKNNRMVRQLNSYVIVSKFQGISLPLLPRIYGAGDDRLKETEKAIFKVLVEESKLEFTKPENLVLQTFIDINNEKRTIVSTEEWEKIEVSASEVSTRIYRSIRTVQTYSSRIHGKIYDAFGLKFPNIHEAAIFIKSIGFELHTN